MGWLFPYGCSLKQMIADRTRGFDNELVKSTCLAHCFRGAPTHAGVLWSVWEHERKDRGGKKERFIVCDVLEYSHTHQGWGYKDIDECMHPYYYSCPLKYLDMVPETEVSVNLEWREGVRAYHERAKQRRAQKKSSVTK